MLSLKKKKKKIKIIWKTKEVRKLFHLKEKNPFPPKFMKKSVRVRKIT